MPKFSRTRQALSDVGERQEQARRRLEQTRDEIRTELEELWETLELTETLTGICGALCESMRSSVSSPSDDLQIAWEETHFHWVGSRREGYIHNRIRGSWNGRSVLIRLLLYPGRIFLEVTLPFAAQREIWVTSQATAELVADEIDLCISGWFRELLPI